MREVVVMRREIIQDSVLLAAYVALAISFITGEVQRWIIALAVALIVLQALRLGKRIVRVRRQRAGDPQ